MKKCSEATQTLPAGCSKADPQTNTHNRQRRLQYTHGHGHRKRGICRGSDTPTIYVGDIDMYIPLEKPNT